MFLPERWPTYFSKAKGCKIWDLDGREYYDLSIMGVGTNTLGYGHPEVDDAVNEAVGKGNLSSFNCPEKSISLRNWLNCTLGLKWRGLLVLVARQIDNNQNCPSVRKER